MKKLIQLASMMDFLPAAVKDAVHAAAKAAGRKTDDLPLVRTAHSEKAKTNQLDPESRTALKRVSARTIDRDGEIVIPEGVDLSEFNKYQHVLLNHNYSLLPVGSDEWIKADDHGLIALTKYADTGEGTTANIVWKLVQQGHLRASSIGFVPIETVEPRDAAWDRCCNKLQSAWPEFEKGAGGLKRLITKGMLLEHSDVSVPCNTDAITVAVAKSFGIGAKVLGELGWGKVIEILPIVDALVEKGGKAPAFGKDEEEDEKLDKDPVTPVAEDEEAEEAEVEDEDGKPKKAPKKKAVGEMAATIDISTPQRSLCEGLKRVLTATFDFYAQAHAAHWNVTGPDFAQWHDLFGRIYEDAWGALDPLAENLRQLKDEAPGLQRIADPSEGTAGDPKLFAIDLASKNDALVDLIKQTFTAAEAAGENGVANFLAERQDAHAMWGWQLRASLGIKSAQATKENPHIPGHSFTACVAYMEGKGYDTEAAKKICGRLKADSGEKGIAGSGMEMSSDANGGYVADNGDEPKCPECKKPKDECECKADAEKTVKGLLAEYREMRAAAQNMNRVVKEFAEWLKNTHPERFTIPAPAPAEPEAKGVRVVDEPIVRVVAAPVDVEAVIKQNVEDALNKARGRL